MISIRDEVNELRGVLAFKRVLENIPKQGKRVEIIFNQPEYTIKVYMPTLQFYKTSQKNNLIQIDGLCTKFSDGEYKLEEFYELIELPIGLYNNIKDSKIGDYLILKVNKE